MSYYIFIQGKRSNPGWELLETIKRSDLAKEVYRNYCHLVSDEGAVKVAMVEAASVEEAKAELGIESVGLEA